MSYPPNEAANEASQTGVRVVSQEIEVQLVGRDHDAFFTPDIVPDMLDSMRRLGDTSLLTNVERVRFYGPDGDVRFVWTNPAPPNRR